MGVPSTPAIVQDVIVVRDVAFSQAQVRQLLSRSRPPSALTSLVQLLPLVGAYSLEGICVMPWEDDMYLMKQWNLCPSVVCGPICLDESFFLFTTVSEFKPDVGENQKKDDSNLTSKVTKEDTIAHDPLQSVAKGPGRVQRKDQHSSRLNDVSMDPLIDEYFDDDLYYDDGYLDYGPYTEEELDYLEAVYGTDYDDGAYQGDDAMDYAYEDEHENGMRVRPNDVHEEQVKKIGRLSSRRADKTKEGTPSGRNERDERKPVSSSSSREQREQQRKQGMDNQHPRTKDSIDAGGNNERGVNGKARTRSPMNRSSHRVTMVKHSAKTSIRLPRLSRTTPALATTINHFTTTTTTTSTVTNESNAVNETTPDNLVSLWIDPIKWAEQTLLLLPQLVETPLIATRRYIVPTLQYIMTLFGAEVKQPSVIPSSTTTSDDNNVATEGTTTDANTSTTTSEQNNNNDTHNHTNTNTNHAFGNSTAGRGNHDGGDEGLTWFPRLPPAQSAGTVQCSTVQYSSIPLTLLVLVNVSYQHPIDLLITLSTHLLDSPYLLSTHLIDTPYQHPTNAPYRHTLSTHPIDPSYQRSTVLYDAAILSTHLIDTPYQHPTNAPYRHALLTPPIDPPYQRTQLTLSTCVYSTIRRGDTMAQRAPRRPSCSLVTPLRNSPCRHDRKGPGRFDFVHLAGR